MKNLKVTKIYFRRAILVATILQITPYVKMIGLTGSLSQKKVKETSDIDFFVVLQKNRLWLGRAIVSVAVHLTGLRRYGHKIPGRICLNRYQTEDYLTVKPYCAANAKHFSWFYPLWWRNGLWPRFQKENLWINDFGYSFKNTSVKQNLLLLILGTILQYPFYFLSELILGDWGESMAKKYQEKRILTDPRTKNSPSGAIYISDTELRFHPEKKFLP